jgi:formate/nitrite transporter FocA (FNT family)
MSDPSDFDAALERRLIPMRIIAFAMPLGAVVALGLFLYLRMQGQFPPPPGTPVLTLVAYGFGLLILFAYLLVPRQMVAASRQRLARSTDGGSAGEWLSIYQLRLIMRLALLEGATFFFLVVYLVEGLPISLAGAGVLLLGMLALFPTRTGVENWITSQRELTQQQGQGSL